MPSTDIKNAMHFIKNNENVLTSNYIFDILAKCTISDKKNITIILISHINIKFPHSENWNEFYPNIIKLCLQSKSLNLLYFVQTRYSRMFKTDNFIIYKYIAQIDNKHEYFECDIKTNWLTKLLITFPSSNDNFFNYMKISSVDDPIFCILAESHKTFIIKNADKCCKWFHKHKLYKSFIAYSLYFLEKYSIIPNPKHILDCYINTSLKTLLKVLKQFSIVLTLDLLLQIYPTNDEKLCWLVDRLWELKDTQHNNTKDVEFCWVLLQQTKAQMHIEYDSYCDFI